MTDAKENPASESTQPSLNTSNWSTEDKIFRGFLHLAENDIRSRLSSGNPSLYDCLLASIYFRQQGDHAAALKALDIYPNTGIYEEFQNRLASYCHQLNWKAALEIARNGLESASPTWPEKQRQHLREVIKVLSPLVEDESSSTPKTRVSPLETCRYYNLDSNASTSCLGLVDSNRQNWRVIDATFDPLSQCWLELSNFRVATELLQPCHDFRSFFGGAKPWKANHYPQAEPADTIHELAVFLETNPHYGHFISQTASYAAAIQHAQLLTSAKHPEIVVLSKNDIPSWGKLILQSSCQNPLQFKVFNPQQSLRARRLVVLPPTFIEWHYIHKSHRSLFSRSASTLLRDNPKAGGQKRIYFSRSQLNIGLRCSANEDLLEQALESKGFEIIHPQAMRLEEVVALVNQSSIIAGAMGSAMHNILFRLPGDPVITLVFAHHLPGINSTLIERCCGINDNLYIRSCEEERGRESGPNLLHFDVPRCLEGVDRALALLS